MFALKDFPVSGKASPFQYDSTMHDLFRFEAETHAATLEKGLVALAPDEATGAKLEPLMRAAHSIKGAARIVGLTAAVELAHVMEDLLVAAQKGTFTLGREAVDLLLRATDLCKAMSKTAATDLNGWITAHTAEIQAARDALTACRTGALTVPSAPAAPAAPLSIPSTQSTSSTPVLPAPKPAESTPPAPAKPAAATTAAEATVPVTADNLSRLLGLSGECLVEARRLPQFGGEMRGLKQQLTEIQQLLAIASGTGADTAERRDDALRQARDISSQARNRLIHNLEQYDQYAMRWETLATRLYRETVATRMRPFGDGVSWAYRLIHDLGRKLDKKIRLAVAGEATRVDRDILARLEAPLTHILNNACDHGIETPAERGTAGKPEAGRITITAAHTAGLLSITIADDGRGIDAEALRRKVVAEGKASPEVAALLSESELLEFLFLPGFSTARAVTDLSGRGVGLDVVMNMVREVGGTIRLQSTLGRGSTLQLLLPLTLSVIRVLFVEIAGEPYAIPLTRVDRIRMLDPGDIERVQDRQYCRGDGANIGLAGAWEPLHLPAPVPPEDGILPVVVISDRLTQYGLVVERVLGEQSVVVRPLDRRLGRIPDISAAAVLDDGTPALILDIDDLVRSIDNLFNVSRVPRLATAAAAGLARKKRILVVDDSITVREVERQMLENQGYEVVTAVDGMDGWNAAREGAFDLIISDVDMPRLNGIDLVRQLRQEPALRELPVIIISYKDREEDRTQGLEAGANAYLTKGSFYDESFLSMVAELLGK